MDSFLDRSHPSWEVTRDIILSRLGLENTNPGAFEVLKSGGGKNSQILRLKTSSADIAVKLFHSGDGSRKDNFFREKAAYELLSEKGFSNILKYYFSDEDRLFLVLKYIDGKNCRNMPADAAMIEQAVDFAMKLYRLSEKKHNIGKASEAGFTIEEVFAITGKRLDRLKSLPGDKGIYLDLFDFLKRFEAYFQGLENHMKNMDEFNRKLRTHEITLSPSDFGFHNAVMNNTGELFFLDFEHFGLDDPAKLIADFVLHPAMALTDETKRDFVFKMLEGFNIKGLQSRLRVLYPVFALKWCMIFLNEFISNDLERRRFAGAVPGDEDNENMLKIQLEKAMAMFNVLEKTNREFPYA